MPTPDPAPAERAVREAVSRFGQLDGVFHVAGGGDGASATVRSTAMTDEGWRATVDLNLTSLFLHVPRRARHFVEQKRGGSILVMTSGARVRAALRISPRTPTPASKAGAIGLMTASAAYYAPHGHPVQRDHAGAGGLRQARGGPCRIRGSRPTSRRGSRSTAARRPAGRHRWRGRLSAVRRIAVRDGSGARRRWRLERQRRGVRVNVRHCPRPGPLPTRSHRDDHIARAHEPRGPRGPTRRTRHTPSASTSAARSRSSSR